MYEFTISNPSPWMVTGAGLLRFLLQSTTTSLVLQILSCRWSWLLHITKLLISPLYSSMLLLLMNPLINCQLATHIYLKGLGDGGKLKNKNKLIGKNRKLEKDKKKWENRKAEKETQRTKTRTMKKRQTKTMNGKRLFYISFLSYELHTFMLCVKSTCCV